MQEASTKSTPIIASWISGQRRSVQVNNSRSSSEWLDSLARVANRRLSHSADVSLFLLRGKRFSETPRPLVSVKNSYFVFGLTIYLRVRWESSGLTLRLFYVILIFRLEKESIMAVSLRLPDDISSRLQNLARLTGRSKTFYMIEAICEHIDDLEDLYLAEQRLIANRAGKSQSLPLEEVMKRYGLEG